MFMDIPAKVGAGSVNMDYNVQWVIDFSKTWENPIVLL